MVDEDGRELGEVRVMHRNCRRIIKEEKKVKRFYTSYPRREEMIRVAIREGQGQRKTAYANVARLDAVFIVNNGPAVMYFRRIGPLDYQPMGPCDVSILHAWMNENGVEHVWDLTLAQVDEAIG